MPELPEVETIRRGLQVSLPGKRITDVTIGDPKIVQIAPKTLKPKLVDQVVRELWRKGKYLVCELDRNLLIFHLGMTGQLTLRDPRRPDPPRFSRHPKTGLQRVRQHPADRHTHLQVHFLDGSTLMFRDVRKFGKVFLLAGASDVKEGFFAKLGLEPFTDSYDLNSFLSLMGRRKIRVKSLLLDQSFVAGVGNIYADESLFEARIHPARRVRYLRKYEKAKLFEVIPEVLERAINHGGTSTSDYINSDGKTGGYQEELQVYGREDRPCRRCGEKIKKIVVSQRGTHFCPRCQRR
jgi:formamidopyrimidine-DNA glycosylase